MLLANILLYNLAELFLLLQQKIKSEVVTLTLQHGGVRLSTQFFCLLLGHYKQNITNVENRNDRNT